MFARDLDSARDARLTVVMVVFVIETGMCFGNKKAAKIRQPVVACFAAHPQEVSRLRFLAVKRPPCGSLLVDFRAQL